MIGLTVVAPAREMLQVGDHITMDNDLICEVKLVEADRVYVFHESIGTIVVLFDELQWVESGLDGLIGPQA